MSTCARDWGPAEGCAGCWAAILQHLVSSPIEPILPRPEFCQDAAYVAFAIDARLASKGALEAVGKMLQARRPPCEEAT